LRGLSSATPPMLCDWVHWLFTRLVVDYFAYVVRPGASALRVARRRLLCLCRAAGCIGSSHSSSSTTSSMPCVSHWLDLDYSSPGCTGSTMPTSCIRTRHLAARFLVGRPHWLSLCAQSLCLAARLLCAPPLDLLSSPTGSTSATLCVATTCLAATSTLLRVHREPPRHRLLATSRGPLISTSFSK
jgi:hypothetical protein